MLIVLGAVLLFGGGGGRQPKPQNVELTWWKTFEDPSNISELISQYQDLHKNVKINYVKKDIATYEQELINTLAAGNSPDIFTIHNDWLPKHQDKLTPMPAQLMGLREFQETFVDLAMFDLVKDGQIYALPLSIDVLALYYNKDILGSAGIPTPPVTWPELVSDVEKITTQDATGNFLKSGIAMGAAGNVNRAVDLLLLLMVQNGTEFYSADLASARFADQQNISGERFNPGATALEFYTQFANPGKKSYTWNDQSDFSVDAFTQSKVGMMLSYYYMIPVIESKAPNLNWAVAPAPQVSATGSKMNFANYWAEGVSKFSPNADVAWDFLKFITGRQQLEGYYEKHKLPASRKDILATQIPDPEIGVFAESVLTAKSVYKKDAGIFETVFLKMIDDVTFRDFTPEEAVRNAAQQINLGLRK
ncbi:MAG: extracellular solute-binding protein [Candidatus Doudnabacteria bacterium]|nr:extracellular solute-binding protein [Candidatus Doudnabacteria bacterium]